MRNFAAWAAITAAITYCFGRILSFPLQQCSSTDTTCGIRTQNFAWDAAVGVFLICAAVGVAVWATNRK